MSDKSRGERQSSDRFLVLSATTLRRLSRRQVLGGAMGLGAATLLGGQASASSGSVSGTRSRAQASTSILIGTLGEAASINPFQSNESEGDWRCKMLFDEFVRADVKDFSPKPGLAAEWSNDGLLFTFKLQPNAKFTDGTDVTADDVAFTIKGHLAKQTASPRQDKFMTIAGAAEYAAGTAQDVTGIKVVDPKTLNITLSKPDAPFLYNMRYVWVVPAKPLQGKNLSNDPWFNNPVGAGPYQFVSWQRGADFVAKANPNYWQAGKPAISTFTHRVIADAQTLVLALQNHEIDASNYPNPAAKKQLEQVSDLTIMAPPFASPNGWMFNFKNQYLAKKEVRQAISMAINTEQYANDSLLGLGGVGVGPISPESWAFDKTLKPVAYDPAKAKAMIKTAGAEGAKIRFNVNQGNVFREDWLTFTQQALKEVGIEVVPELLEYASLVDRVTKNHDYDVSGVDFCGVTAEPSELADQFRTGAPGNYMGYSNPALDKLLDQARGTIDTKTAKPIYDQIQKIIVDDMPFFFAWYRPFLHAVNKKFTNYTDSAAYGLFQTLEDWKETGS